MLVLESPVYIASGTVSGMVQLDYRKAIDDGIETVKVKLLGVAST
jgi:hypothetical protein